MAALAKEVVSNLDDIDLGNLDNDDAARSEIIAAARRLLSRLETPFEQVWRLSWVNINTFVVCQILVDLGLWEAWAAAGGCEASLEDLFGLCRTPCDMMLLRKWQAPPFPLQVP